MRGGLDCGFGTSDEIVLCLELGYVGMGNGDLGFGIGIGRFGDFREKDIKEKLLENFWILSGIFGSLRERLDLKCCE